MGHKSRVTGRELDADWGRNGPKWLFDLLEWLGVRESRQSRSQALDERAADVDDGAFITFDEHNRQRDE